MNLVTLYLEVENDWETTFGKRSELPLFTHLLQGRLWEGVDFMDNFPRDFSRDFDRSRHNGLFHLDTIFARLHGRSLVTNPSISWDRSAALKLD